MHSNPELFLKTVELGTGLIIVLIYIFILINEQKYVTLSREMQDKLTPISV